MNNINIYIPLGKSNLEWEFTRNVLEQMRPEDSDIASSLLLELNKNRQQSLVDESPKEVEDILYSKFFKKEFEEIKQSGTITPEQLKKFTTLNELIWPRGKNDTTQISEFKQDFKKIKDRYFAQALKSDIGNGVFTLSKFEKYKDLYSVRRKSFRTRIYYKSFRYNDARKFTPIIFITIGTK